MSIAEFNIKIIDRHKKRVIFCKDCGKKWLIRADRNHSGFCRRCSRLGERNPMYEKPSWNKGQKNYNRNKYFRKIKRELVLLKGNKCAMCGAENLPLCCYDFHHLKPKNKDFQIAKITLYKIATIEKELEKCIIVCANCHRIIHHTDIRANDEEEFIDFRIFGNRRN